MAQVEITVREGTAYLGNFDVDEDLREAVMEATQFKRAGMEFRIRDKRDPHVKLIRNNKCPVGLLDRVCREIVAHGHEPAITWADEPTHKPDMPFDFTGYTPRDYQDEAGLAAALNARGIFRAPTGAGKTIMAMMAIQARGKHAVVIVPTIDLLHQFRGVLRDHTPGGYENEIGQLGDGKVEPGVITVATVRTMAKAMNVAFETYEFGEYDDKDDTEVHRAQLREWIESLGTVVVDEAHQLGADVVYDIVTKVPALNKYGFSASPWRDDGADLMIEAATGPLIYRVETERLVREGHLMAPTIVSIDTRGWWRSAAWGRVCRQCGHQALQWAKECDNCGAKNRFKSQFTECYRHEIVENPLRNARIAEKVIELDRPTLLLVKQVKHGRLLADLIPDAVFLSGKATGKDRANIFTGMRAGIVKVVICTTIGDLGLDIPILEALVLAGGGKSSTRHLQRIGRVVRVAEGKKRPLVLDLDDSHVHHWFANHVAARRKIEHAEWFGTAKWLSA